MTADFNAGACLTMLNAFVFDALHYRSLIAKNGRANAPHGQVREETPERATEEHRNENSYSPKTPSLRARRLIAQTEHSTTRFFPLVGGDFRRCFACFVRKMRCGRSYCIDRSTRKPSSPHTALCPVNRRQQQSYRILPVARSFRDEFRVSKSIQICQRLVIWRMNRSAPSSLDVHARLSDLRSSSLHGQHRVIRWTEWATQPPASNRRSAAAFGSDHASKRHCSAFPVSSSRVQSELPLCSMRAWPSASRMQATSAHIVSLSQSFLEPGQIKSDFLREPTECR